MDEQRETPQTVAADRPKGLESEAGLSDGIPDYDLVRWTLSLSPEERLAVLQDFVDTFWTPEQMGGGQWAGTVDRDWDGEPDPDPGPQGPGPTRSDIGCSCGGVSRMSGKYRQVPQGLRRQPSVSPQTTDRKRQGKRLSPFRVSPSRVSFSCLPFSCLLLVSAKLKWNG